MNDIHHLRHLIALADHGNFRLAARAAHVSQPALTKSIQGLERWYGVKLFDRQPQGVVPTALGLLVVERARRVAADLDEIKKEVDLRKGMEDAELAVGAGPLIADSILAPALGRLIERHRGLRVSIKLDHWRTLTEALDEGRIELFVAEIAEARFEKRFQVVALPRQTVVWFCRCGHPLLLLPKVSQADLLKFPIVSGTLPTRVQKWFARANSQAEDGAKPTPLTIACDSYPVLKKIVQMSHAVSAAVPSVIAEEVRQGTLALLPVDAPQIQSFAGVVSLRRRTLAPVALELTSELLNECPSADINLR
jgi:DNA-binding transcriptional LysR family regulator